jgi:hypothetical protein
MLHVTNGDSAAERLRHAGLEPVLPWRDALHHGPVPADAGEDELRDVRAKTLAGLSGRSAGEEAGDLRRRDEALAAAAGGPLTLWFESDLYDVLQLAQILTRLDDLRAPDVGLVLVDEHVGRFVGVGELEPRALAALAPARRRLPPEALAGARAAWRAFRSPDPRVVEELVRTGTPALPALAVGLGRHLEEFPALGDGLARTERSLLGRIGEGHRRPVEAFLAYARTEERPFLGDRGAWAVLDELAAPPAPLLAGASAAYVPFAPAGDDPAFLAQELALTELGARVLAGHGDRAEHAPPDRWLGGVHLTAPTPAWRWDRDARTLRAAPV